ncbi:MAG: 2-dehydropantoate 2-reductase [Deltaproteobacteria bacterium]|nr:2-dehydropantoate 2-reductase [Deltaproteobacteria bacterium]
MASGNGPGSGAERLNIAVVGVGPVGSILAAWLAKAGHHVGVVDIDEPHIAAIRKDGLHVEGMREAHGKPAEAVLKCAELGARRWDFVAVSTKASILHTVMPDAALLAGKEGYVVSVQNGLDTEQELAAVEGPDRTLRMIVNYAGGKVAAGRIKMMFFNGHNAVGTMTPQGEAAARRFAALVDAAGLETDYTDNVRKFEWEKTILNAAMSPLCALTDLTMRECFESPKMNALSKALLVEGIAVAKADGYEWEPGFLDHCVTYLSKAGHHRASMWVDVSNKRPTEIRFLNGRIADVGDQRGVPAPLHRTISTLIEGIEQSWASPHR